MVGWLKDKWKKRKSNTIFIVLPKAMEKMFNSWSNILCVTQSNRVYRKSGYNFERHFRYGTILKMFTNQKLGTVQTAISLVQMKFCQIWFIICDLQRWQEKMQKTQIWHTNHIIGFWVFWCFLIYGNLHDGYLEQLALITLVYTHYHDYNRSENALF